MKYVLLTLILSGCCDYKDAEAHVIATKDGCTVYQVACEQVFFTKCGGTVTTTARECHLVGKIMVCNDSTNTTVAPSDSSACCPGVP